MIQNEVKNTNVVLKTSGLSKHYGSKKSLDNVSITINQGDIYGLIGKNGAGKTTFMKTCLGMVQATSGTCQILGSNDPKNLRKVGALIETPSIYVLANKYDIAAEKVISCSTDFSFSSIDKKIVNAKTYRASINFIFLMKNK